MAAVHELVMYDGKYKLIGFFRRDLRVQARGEGEARKACSHTMYGFLIRTTKDVAGEVHMQ